MVRADRRITSALHGIVEKHPHELFILTELPDESPLSLLQRSAPSLMWLYVP